MKLNQKMFSIFFVSFFIFGLFMFIKEKREVPSEYEENIKKSLMITKSQIVPNLKKVLGEASTDYGTKGVRNNLKYDMSYALVFQRPTSLQQKKNLLREEGWIEYNKNYQENEISTFCKDKFQLTLTLEIDDLFVEVLYDRLSPCWNFEEEIKKGTFSLVN